MKGRTTALAAAMIAAVGIGALVHGDDHTPQGKSFGSVDPDYTQELFATTSSFQKGGSYLGGVAVLPNGDVVTTECVNKDTRMHRFSATLTTTKNGTAVHTETFMPASGTSPGGCGIVYYQPDNSLYLAVNDGTHGVVNVNATTGAFIRFLGTPGNAVGIAVDPVSNHIVYADKNCVSTARAPAKCSLLDLDPVTGVTVTRASFPLSSVGFVNGMYFDPGGGFMFLSNRFPTPTVTVVDATLGTIVQNLDMAGSDPVGIGFNALSPKFVATNNTDGSMTRFDFPNDDYTQVPTSTYLAQFGYRGDLMQAGPDGCLYVTQGGARYDDGTDEGGSKSNSLARICGGFAPPAGVPTNAPPVAQGTLLGTVSDALTGNPLVSAKVLVATGTGLSVNTDAGGNYSLKLAPGTYTATASLANYTSLTTPGISILNTKATTANFALMPLPGTLQGVVTSAATGSPIANALVSLSGGPSIGKSDTTDSSGRYVITSVLPGTYTATVSQTYYDTQTQPNVLVPINATATVNFALTQTPGTIQGTVTGNAGAIAGATVTLSNGAVATTDGNGLYAFASVTPGIYSATARAATFLNMTITNISLPNAGSKTVDFPLAPVPGTLQGIVRNAAGTVIANATVAIAGKTAKTNASGFYSIINITPGTYGVTVTATNYDVYSAVGIVIANAATVAYDVTLTQTPGPISGIVRDTAARPLAGATVTLSNGMATTTDAGGSYGFASVTPGAYTVTGSLATYANASVNVVLLNASFVKQDITLAPLPGALSGVVTNAAGNPIASAIVTFAGKSASTDASGFYKIVSITPGTYTATVTASNYDKLTADVAIGNAANVTRDFSLTQTPGTLKGLVMNAANAPIAGAVVTLSNGGTATTDAAGAYSIASIMPGTYTATVTASNYNSLVASGIVIPNGGTVSKNFTLTQSAGKLSGTVTVTGGTTAIANATVTLSTGVSVQTSATGTYLFASLNPGSYTVTAAASTYKTSPAVTVVIPNATPVTQDFSLTPLPGTVTGVVKDGAGAAIVGATIQLTGGTGVVTTATSGSGGAYTISAVAPGTYSASASMPAFTTQVVPSVIVANAGTTTQNFTLTAQPGALKGVVSDSKGPIAGATVALSGSGGSATTDASGAYLFASVAPGTYVATVSAPTYNTATVPGIAIESTATTTQNVTLTPVPGSLKGLVSNGTTPIVGATVTLSNGGGAAITDASGAYAFASLTPGSYTATVSASGYTSLAGQSVSIGNGAIVTKNFTLTPLPGTIQGVVTSTSGGDLAGASVSLMSGAATVATATAGSSGAYAFTSVTPGTYSMAASLATYSSQTAAPVVLAKGGTTTQNFQLAPLPGALKGTVKNATGPIAGATVTLSNGGGSAATDATGAYAFASLAPGAYTATVNAAGFVTLTDPGIVIANAATTTRNFTLVPLKSDVMMTATAPSAGTSGTTLAYSFTATSRINVAAAGVVVTHVLPAQTSFVSLAAPPGWSCTKPAAGLGGTIACSRAAMAVGETATFGVSVQISCPFNSPTLVVSATATTTSADADLSNNSASAATTITNALPTISGASVDNDTLWPPNHKMQDVQVNYTLTGSCGAAATATLTITSDEGSADDYKVIDAHHVQVRSERLGSNDGRVYTITINATVDGRAIVRKSVTVSVVHDQGNGKK